MPIGAVGVDLFVAAKLSNAATFGVCSSVRLNKYVQVSTGTRSRSERVASRSTRESAVAPAARAARMRAANLENEVSSHLAECTGQQ